MYTNVVIAFLFIFFFVYIRDAHSFVVATAAVGYRYWMERQPVISTSLLTRVAADQK